MSYAYQFAISNLVRTPTIMLARSAQSLRRMSSPYSAAFSTNTDITFANLQIQRTTNPKVKLPKEELKFGKTFTDHMLEVDWEMGKDG
ncbi:hypothetical protein Plhal304r1_c091g0171861 [Plasmopara halstedii]